MRVCRISPDVGEAGGFGAHHYRGPAGHVRVIVPFGILKLGCVYLYSTALEPADGFFRGGGSYRHGEYSADA